MDPYRTEEDQIRALKQWWERNGSSTLIGVGLALALVFGWQWWQQRRQAASEEATAVYQQLLQAADKSAEDPIQRTTAEHLASQLEESRPGSRYADYAALMRARLQVEKGDLAAAEATLRALLERQPDTVRGALATRVDELLGRHPDAQIGALARVRLARVLFALGRADDALATLDAAGTEDFAIEKLELRGDILRDRKDIEGARKAYRDAIAVAGARPEGAAPSLLDLKLQELELVQTPVPGAGAAGAAPAGDAGAAGTGATQE